MRFYSPDFDSKLVQKAGGLAVSRLFHYFCDPDGLAL